MSAVRSVLAIFLTATTSLVAVPRVSAGSDAPVFDSASPMCALNEFDWEVEVSDRLQVNLRRSPRIISPSKCQKEGEEDLIELAASAVSEEAYAFIPSLCTWIETGYHETDRSVRLDKALVNELIKCYKNVSLYHIHPGLSEDILWHFPAYTDMLVAVLIHGKFLDQPFVSIRHHAVTVRGTFTYSFVVSEETKGLVETMKATGLADFVPENLAYEYARGKHRTKYYEAVRKCGQRSRSSEDDLTPCFPMRAGDFVLEFSEPYP